MMLSNKVALVTGAGAGIGRSTALMFHQDGAKVVVVDRNEAAAHQVAQEIHQLGGEALAVLTDVSQEDQVENMVKTTIEHFGRLDCASNNAALGSGFNLIPDILDKDWEKCQAVTLKAVWLCLKYQIPAMLKTGGGAIVNITSLSGIRGEALQAPYSAAKGGVIALTKTAAAEYAQRGIRINAIAPGAIQTAGLVDYFQRVPKAKENTEAVHAMRRVGKPEEIADAVVYLLSDRASFITGEVLNVDGGIMVNPHTL